MCSGLRNHHSWLARVIYIYIRPTSNYTARELIDSIRPVSFLHTSPDWYGMTSVWFNFRTCNYPFWPERLIRKVRFHSADQDFSKFIFEFCFPHDVAFLWVACPCCLNRVLLFLQQKLRVHIHPYLWNCNLGTLCIKLFLQKICLSIPWGDWFSPV